MLKGDENLVDALLFAFGLEKGSYDFYVIAASKMEDPRSKEVFLSMSEVERGHMAEIRLLYCGMENEACPVSIEEMSEASQGPYLEGGRLLSDALKDLDVAFLDKEDALKAAIKQEGQATVFYEKASKRMQDSYARVLFEEFAKKEKKHLEELSRLLSQERVTGTQ